MDALIWEPGAFWIFVALTLVIGGVTAWASGSAVAKTWRPLAQAIAYSALLACGIRFLHYALFEGVFFISPETPAAGFWYWLVTFAILSGISVLGYARSRSAQMKRQYSWLSGPGQAA